MSAPTIEAIAQTVEEVGKEHASSTGQGPKTDHNAQAAIGTWSSAGRHLRETMRSLFERIKRLGQGLNLPGEDKPFSVPTPDVVPAGGQFVAKSYSNHAGTRAYKLYVPNAYKGQPLPLIVMLHGSTQSADVFAAGTRMNTIAEECIFLVAYPEQPAAANASMGWNWFPAGRPAAWPR